MLEVLREKLNRREVLQVKGGERTDEHCHSGTVFRRYKKS